MKDAETRAALITGGGQGIGRAITARLLEAGWRAAILEIDEEAARDAEAEYGPGGGFAAIVGNVSSEDDVKRAVGETVERFGRLDGLVNNAGGGGFMPFAELSLAEWNRVIGVNLTGAFLGARETAPYLRQTGGAIVNITSTRALMSEPNTEAYSASKGGLVALTHAMAVTLGPEIRVNCISPGWIETAEWKIRSKRRAPSLRDEDHAQHPCGRVGRPEDIAALAHFLLDREQSGFITGANIVCDGGMTRKMIYAE